MAQGFASKPGGSIETDATLSAWLTLAATEAAKIGAEQDAAVLDWAQSIEAAGGSVEDALSRLRELPRVMHSDDLVELNAQVTLAAMLRGMFAAEGPGSGGDKTIANSSLAGASGSDGSADGSELIANSSSLFAKLPFMQAVNGLAERLGLIKYSGSRARGDTGHGTQTGERLPSFMELDADNRSRAFTMAWVQNLDHMQQIHDELVETINNGESLYDWRMKHIEAVKARGWEGSPLGESHYQLVYHQNLGMAYTAGRYERGTETGFKVVRILPTLSMSPRPEHAVYAGSMFRIDAGSMLPPWDFGCNCGWEWVFPEELDGVDVESLPLLRFDDAGQDFKWRPAAYMALSIDPGRYTGVVADVAKDMGGA